VNKRQALGLYEAQHTRKHTAGRQAYQGGKQAQAGFEPNMAEHHDKQGKAGGHQVDIRGALAFARVEQQLQTYLPDADARQHNHKPGDFYREDAAQADITGAEYKLSDTDD